MGLLSLLPIVGITLFFSRLLRAGTAVACLHAVAASILVLYVGGLVGMLWWTALLIHLAGVGLLGYEGWRFAREPRPLPVAVPLVMLIVATALFPLIHGASQYVFYDEYSHWGVYLKEMLALDGFWAGDTNSLHPRYPPAAPLWQYLFNVFRAPSEGTAYLAQFVLLVTPLLVLFERIEWRRAGWILLIVALCALGLSNFGLGIASLYVDHVIATWFIGTILCFAFDNPDWRRGLMFALPLTVLALIKESSLAFALAAAGTLGLLLLQQQWATRGFRLNDAARSFGLATLFAASAVLSLQIWGWQLDRAGAPEDLEAVGGIVAGITGDSNQLEPGQGEEITRRFLEVFSDQQLANDGVSRQFNAFSYSIMDLYTEPFRLTTRGLFVVYVLWWVVLLAFVLRGSDRWRWGIASVSVLGTAVAFLLALYLSYRYASGEYGLVVSSYTRYVHTIALPMLIISFAPLLPAFRQAGAGRIVNIGGRDLPWQVLLAIIGCIGLYWFETPYLRPLYETNPTMPVRQQLEPTTNTLVAQAGRSPVWVYLPNDYPNEFVGQLLQYLLAPAPTVIERDELYFTRPATDIRSAWAGYRIVWLAGELDAAAATSFHEITGHSLDSRAFSVVGSSVAEVQLEPLELR